MTEPVLDMAVTYDVTSGTFVCQFANGAKFNSPRSDWPDRVQRMMELLQRATIKQHASARGIKTDNMSTEEINQLVRAYRGQVTRPKPKTAKISLEDLDL